MAAGLTPKQQRFVEEYLVDLNATQAAIRAGYSSKTAKSQGQRMLTNVDIENAIQRAVHKRSERTEITQDYVLEKLKEIADKSASDAQDSNLKYSNKLKALELLGKHLGLFEKTEGNTQILLSSGDIVLLEKVSQRLQAEKGNEI